MDALDLSYEEFKTAIHSSLAERLRERLATQKQIISNEILADPNDNPTTETQSNAEEN
jgi:hypothetical protein